MPHDYLSAYVSFFAVYGPLGGNPDSNISQRPSSGPPGRESSEGSISKTDGRIKASSGAAGNPLTSEEGTRLLVPS